MQNWKEYPFYYDAEILWNYHHLDQSPKAADCILVFGSHDVRVVERAAELYHEGFADYVLFTGGRGRITGELWKQAEAEKFAALAEHNGVPRKQMIIENTASNTGENIAFSKRLVEEQCRSFHNYLAVDKPYRERRTWAALCRQWPEARWTITSPVCSFDDYLEYYACHRTLTVGDFISIMVGDIQRIAVYGERGFQLPQDIPIAASRAYHSLIRQGFDSQLLKTEIL